MKARFSPFLILLLIMLSPVVLLSIFSQPLAAISNHHSQSNQLSFVPSNTLPYEGRFGMNNVNNIYGPLTYSYGIRRTAEHQGEFREQLSSSIGATSTRWVLLWHLIHPQANLFSV